LPALSKPTGRLSRAILVATLLQALENHVQAVRTNSIKLYRLFRGIPMNPVSATDDPVV
jgi:hypothetical protein